jgi:hypothetical protein
VQYLEIQQIFTGHAILHTLVAIIITLREPSPTIYGPSNETQSPFTIMQFDGVEFFRERKKNRQKDPHTFSDITSHPLGMGIHSISGNYSPLNSLSNGTIILESFLTNLNILATKVGKNKNIPYWGLGAGEG